MQLTRYKLGQLLDASRGASLAGEYYAEQGKLIRLTLGNFDLANGGFKPNISKSDIYFTGPVREEFILNKGDIITPLTEQTLGLLGSTARIPESGKYIQSQDVALIKCKENLLDPSFAYYLISSKQVRNQLSAAAQQTKIRHTTPDKLKDCVVDIPSIEEQRKIGKLLDSISEKIALNRQTNCDLEAMAKQLYDYWFVQFATIKDKSQIKKISLGEIIDCTGGSQPPASQFIFEPREGYVRFVQIRDYASDNHITYIPIREANKICEEHDVMLARYGASLGRVCYGLNGAYNVALSKITPTKDYYREFVRCYLKTNKFYKTINLIGARCAQAGFGREDINGIMIDFPCDDSIIKKFEEKVSPMFELQLTLLKENRLLTERRDALLSLLMNGQVRIKQ